MRCVTMIFGIGLSARRRPRPRLPGGQRIQSRRPRAAARRLRIPKSRPTARGWRTRSGRPTSRKTSTRPDIWMTSWDGKETVRLTTGKESETDAALEPGRPVPGVPLGPRRRQRRRPAVAPAALGRRGGEDHRAEGRRRGLRLVPGRQAPRARRQRSRSECACRRTRSGKKPKTKKPIVIDRFQFKLDGYGYLGARRKHLYLLDRDSRKVEQLTTGNYDEQVPAWSPDGRTIAFVSKRGTDPDRTDNWDVFAIEPRAGAAARKLTTLRGLGQRPRVGRQPARRGARTASSIAYVQGGPDKLIYYGLHKLAVVPAAGGPERVLTATLDRNVLSPHFTADGSAILFMLEDDQAVHLAKIPVAGGPVQRIVGGRRVISGFSTAAGHTAILSSTPQVPDEIYAVEAGEPRRLSAPERRLARRGPARGRRGDELQEQGRHRDPRLRRQAAGLPGRNALPGRAAHPRRPGRPVRVTASTRSGSGSRPTATS